MLGALPAIWGGGGKIQAHLAAVGSTRDADGRLPRRSLIHCAHQLYRGGLALHVRLAYQLHL